MNSFDFASATDFSHIGTAQKNHLKDVYKHLTLLLLLSAIGCYTQIYVKPIPQGLTAIAAIIALLYVKVFNPYVQGKENDTSRLIGFSAFGFFEGAAVGGLVEQVLHIDPNLVLYAFVGTLAIFASFSMVALLADERQYLYLGGLLVSAINIMLFLSLLNLFVRTSAIPWVQLYGGLVVFCLYVIYDTQVIVAKARDASKRDALGNSLELFIDFVAIFVRILIILAKNSEKKKKKNDN